MRLFTAIEIAADVKAALAALVDRLRPLAKLHWTPVEKLHVTTKFIGEWPEDRLEELKRALRTVPAPTPVEVSIRRIGWLPNPRSARVLYAGVEASETLTALAAATERIAVTAGVGAEPRMYRPHVTLARTRKTVPLVALKRTLAEIELSDIGHYTASSFSLYLSASGTYTKLEEFSIQS
ncbi:MAG TPA: RNA 2',3'-cyclic phosphodiesterase [Bryobacteraceae bacterium]|nr:RNA 2',3'-cyclic phosphodiesterase [Bryobacteraceae bacterium]